ncbi:685_t:CDS:1, partial [Racocetra persica]
MKSAKTKTLAEKEVKEVEVFIVNLFKNLEKKYNDLNEKNVADKEKLQLSIKPKSNIE